MTPDPAIPMLGAAGSLNKLLLGASAASKKRGSGALHPDNYLRLHPLVSWSEHPFFWVKFLKACLIVIILYLKYTYKQNKISPKYIKSF